MSEGIMKVWFHLVLYWDSHDPSALKCPWLSSKHHRNAISEILLLFSVNAVMANMKMGQLNLYDPAVTIRNHNESEKAFIEEFYKLNRVSESIDESILLSSIMSYHAFIEKK
jgi:hypothetical protein